jgi:superfamily I DNA/RNA helicase
MIKKRVISPPKEDWYNLRQPLQSGEIEFINWLDDCLHLDWEIYIQPHLNGCCPDVVILNPKIGIGVFEVKDWDFDALEYYVEDKGNGRKHLMALRNGEVISFVKKNPVDQLLLYRREILDIYCPILSNKNSSLVVTCGLILPKARIDHVDSLIKPIFNDRNRKVFSKPDCVVSNYFVMSAGDFEKKATDVFPDSIARFSSKYMNEVIAGALRIWLVEADAVKEQREIVKYNKDQQDFIMSRTKSGYRRVRGSAGSGKSVLVAGRAAVLLEQSKKILIVTFNITLLNYLQDLTVRVYPRARKEAVWLNFHSLCKRLCYEVGMQENYADLFLNLEGKDFPENDVFCAVINSAIDNSESEKYDAILVDEGQDFNPEWWNILRRLLVEGGEMLLVADSTQDIYNSARLWTDEAMSKSGFRGAWAEFSVTYRLPDNLIILANRFAEKYLPSDRVLLSKEEKKDDQLDILLEKGNVAELRWISLSSLSDDELKKLILDFRMDVGCSKLSNSDITILVQNNEIGFSVCRVLDGLRIKNLNIFSADCDEARRKKMYFFKGDSRVKVSTVHSFKGWEAKAVLVLFGVSRSKSDYALLYTAITRLKSGLGSIMYVACTDPSLAHLESEWSSEYTLKPQSAIAPPTHD